MYSLAPSTMTKNLHFSEIHVGSNLAISKSTASLQFVQVPWPQDFGLFLRKHGLNVAVCETLGI